jgi:RHS repeat-associated protein
MAETSKGTDRLTFKYDYLGRRVEKCVYSGNTLVSKTLYVYDGFKCVEELDALDGNALLRRHAWQPFDAGLDVILATTDAAGTSFFLHDASKNVMQKTGATGALQEAYAYAPFGECIAAVPADIGFSSEQYDAHTALDYYNYRYLAPGLGRWTRRDPMTELDSINLYSYCKNEIIISDYLGLKNYKIGIDDPKITPDVGAGEWGSTSPTSKMRVIKRIILLKPTSLTVPDALNHLKHYLHNNGTEYTIRFSKMISDLPSLQQKLEDEITEAMEFVEGLTDGIYYITSQEPSSVYADKEENWNWFYAVGGYNVWGKGVAKVSGNGTCFTLNFEFKFYDRYNWDTGKFVDIFGVIITDKIMGDFHRQALAKEFDMVGSIKKKVSWRLGDNRNLIIKKKVLQSRD